MPNQNAIHSLLLALACAPVSLSLRAQQAVEDDIIEQIVVTSQRREERLQEVPISATVVSGEVLTRKNLTSLEALSQSVPSVRVDPAGGRANPVFVRGIGSGPGQAFDQSVGIFIDDIYYGRSRFTAATFLDLARVEILKGPQSSFFGNNAIAGAINIESRKPTDSFENSARALYGQYNEHALEAAIGGPLTDKLAVRFAALSAGRDGWLKNVNTGRDEPSEDSWASRLTLAYQATENLEATLKVEFSDTETSGLPLQVINCPRPTPPFGPTGGGGPNGSCAVATALGTPTGIDNNSTAHGPEGSDFEPSVFVLNTQYRRWDHTFTSVTGYQDYDFSTDIDGDGLPTQFLNGHFPEQYHQFSQEFRVTSPSGERFEYVAGAYYQSSGLRFAQALGIFSAGPLIGGLPAGQQIDFAQDEETRSLFASLSWHATDRLKLTGGVRGSWVEKDYDYSLFWGTATQAFGGVVPYDGALCTETSAATGTQAVVGSIFRTPPCAFSGERKDDDIYPSANIQYQITPDAMVYARFDRSFKAGGINGTDTTGNAANLQYNPEHVTAYEVGLKSTWLDNHLLVNVAAFRMEYRDLQVLVNAQDAATGNVVSLVRNAAASRSQGVELETQWVLNDAFRLTADVTYLDARYRHYPNSQRTFLETFCAQNVANTYCANRYPQGIGLVTDISGMQMPQAPKWTALLSATYSARLPNDYTFIANASSFYSSDWYRDLLDEWNGDYTKFDARLSLESPGGHWAVDIIGKNLTDRDIPASVSAGQGLFAIKQQPRSIAGQIRYEF